MSSWTHKCSLCDARFKSEAAIAAHIALHTKNGKHAKIVVRGSEQTDYSDAEYELNRKYGI